ncbi:transcription factor BHLH156-like [Phragmites australis]|uniref:transcription factor BHLH156-like n=1 Tax=Phragmites australis TaxID=29695 RepID=UPI002D79B50C|nr:transcription factor BHLH156-like [Phragmites australis]
MDMEHQLHQLLHFSPQEHLMVSSGFFDVGRGGPAHLETSVFVEPVGAVAGTHDSAWVEDLMQQLGDELFGGDVDAAGTGDHQPWQCDGGSPDDPLSLSMDGNGSPPPGEQGAGELASEPQRDDGDVSAATRKRRDRSKTIVSERKRRVRMKETLYELRSLVPNITKMDKASIIADAMVYVQNLQSYARKLKEEVATLEARPGSPNSQQQQGRRQDRGAPPADGGNAGSAGHGARVTHVGATQVGEGRFFVTVECERRDGVAVPLCAAAESLACFRVESSSLGRSGPDRVASTLTLKVSDQVGDASATTIGEGTVKLWVMAALLKEGFRPEVTVENSS